MITGMLSRFLYRSLKFEFWHYNTLTKSLSITFRVTIIACYAIHSFPVAHRSTYREDDNGDHHSCGRPILNGIRPERNTGRNSEFPLPVGDLNRS
jgi:hypothetical protein